MQSGWVEIFFLAMLAGFIGLRLYHVLGRRTGHEKPVGDNVHRLPTGSYSGPAAEPDAQPFIPPKIPDDVTPEVRLGLEEVIQADRSFNPENFVTSAQTAYQMILHAFWSGDIAPIKNFISDEIFNDLQANIDARTDRGEHIRNQLLQVDNASIVGAQLNGMMAAITLRFDAEIMAATYDSDDQLVSGSTSESIQTHDVWTFSRHVSLPDPTWILVALDEADDNNTTD